MHVVCCWSMTVCWLSVQNCSYDTECVICVTGSQTMNTDWEWVSAACTTTMQSMHKPCKTWSSMHPNSFWWTIWCSLTTSNSTKTPFNLQISPLSIWCFNCATGVGGYPNRWTPLHQKLQHSVLSFLSVTVACYILKVRPHSKIEPVQKALGRSKTWFYLFTY